MTLQDQLFNRDLPTVRAAPKGMGELLPACNTIIFDEAHQLPEVAGLFFGESASTSQIIELARDTKNEAIVLAKDYPALQDAARAPNPRSQIGLGGQRILLADCRFKAVGVWRRIRCRATKSRRLAAACAGLGRGLSGAPRIRCAGKQDARSKAL